MKGRESGRERERERESERERERETDRERERERLRTFIGLDSPNKTDTKAHIAFPSVCTLIDSFKFLSSNFIPSQKAVRGDVEI